MEVSPNNYHFAGWATRSNRLCSDGRTIMPDAFKHQDGEVVPLVWNHQDKSVNNVLGKALLHCVDGDVYAYCLFNDTEAGQIGQKIVQHGDVCALSIRANQLKHNSSRGVTHGMIRDLSLVLAGANPGAFIDSISMSHGEDADEEVIIFHGDSYGDAIDLPEEDVKHTEDDATVSHSDAEEETKEDDKKTEETDETVTHADEGNKNEDDAEDDDDESEEDDESMKDILDTLNEKQQTVVYGMLGTLIEELETLKNNNINHSEGGDETMKNNVFDQTETKNDSVLSHAAQAEIIELAKSSGVGSLKTAMKAYVEGHSDTLSHGIDEIEQLFPDFKDVHPGAPELLERDQSWVGLVMRKAHKSPISRIRTRQADARIAELKAKGYNDREVAKSLSGNIRLIMRTTDPQTVYRRDELHRDDIIDITDFDVVAYQKLVMKHNMEEDIALAALVGDGREDTDPDKIHETHIRSIWKDDDLYTIHADVDVAKAKAELQGSNTGANFGDNYIYAEAIITAALYSREQYKGKGQLDFYCTPHLLNVMLLARDLNGRRIYDSKADLAKALNVGEIVTVEQFEGLTRTTKDGHTKKLLGIFVNMANYQFGCTKGGEITNFEDFDIDFNKYKYLMETRLSGALTEVYSAIALEEDVTAAG